jgi:plasmid segregation protein ParM
MDHLGLDIGFASVKTVTQYGFDAFPAVVGDWPADGFRLGGGLDGRDAGALVHEGRAYLVGERALRLASRRFASLGRTWFESPAYRVLAITALRRTLVARGRTVSLVTGLPVDDLKQHAEAVKLALEGTHKVEVLPEHTPWDVTIAGVTVIPQPLGTLFAEILTPEGQLLTDGERSGRVGVLDVGFRTSDFFTLQGFDVVEAECFTRNTGAAQIMMELSRVIAREHGLELDPHAVDEAVLRGTIDVAGEARPLRHLVASLLDRHAEAIIAHATMCWGDQAKGLRRVYLTGGGAQLLGERLLRLGPHAKLVARPGLHNAEGYFRFARRLRGASAAPATRA